MGVHTLRPSGTFNDASPPFLRMGGTTNAGVLADNSTATYIYEQNRTLGSITFGVDFPDYTQLPAGAIITSVTPRVTIWGNGSGTASDGSGQGGIYFRLVSAVGMTDNFRVPKAVWEVHSGASEPRTESGTSWAPADVNTLHLRVTFKGFYSEVRIGEVFLDITYDEAPTATATGTGTVSTSRPTLTHTYADPETATQKLWRWKVFTAAQYGAAGFDPNTSVAAWDSGVKSGPGTSTTVDTDLVNGTTYRAFIFVSDTTSGHWNLVTAAGPYRQFSVVLDPPATPRISATLDAEQVPTLALQGFDNTLSADEASFEASLGTWAAYSGCTIARSTAQAAHGVASMGITATGAGSMVARMPVGTNAKPVTPGARFRAELSTRANSGAATRFVRLDVYWFKADGTFSTVLASSEVGRFRNQAAAWETIGGPVVAPSDAAYGSLQVTVEGVTTAGELHFVDKLGLMPDDTITPRSWTIGGLLASQRFVLERSSDSGTTWESVRALIDPGTEGDWTPLGTADISDVTQSVTVKDYEAQRGVPVLYRVRTTATVGGQQVASGFSGSAGPVTAGGSGWMLRDILNPSLSIPLNALGTELVSSSTEEQEVFYPLGRQNAVVVSGAIHGETFPLELHFSSEADFQAFERLRQRQSPLLLQTPHEHLYIRLGPVRDKIRRWGPTRIVRTSVIEVDPPLVA